MTEIYTKKMEIRKGVSKWCAVDNHNKKSKTTYSIIFKTDTFKQLRDYMIEKGIWS